MTESTIYFVIWTKMLKFPRATKYFANSTSWLEIDILVMMSSLFMRIYIYDSWLHSVRFYGNGGKPLPKQMLTYCDINNWGQITMRCESPYKDTKHFVYESASENFRSSMMPDRRRQISWRTQIKVLLYHVIWTCVVFMAGRLTVSTVDSSVSTYRVYPAKRALSAMRKHGG